MQPDAPVVEALIADAAVCDVPELVGAGLVYSPGGFHVEACPVPGPQDFNCSLEDVCGCLLAEGELDLGSLETGVVRQPRAAKEPCGAGVNQAPVDDGAGDPVDIAYKSIPFVSPFY